MLNDFPRNSRRNFLRQSVAAGAVAATSTGNWCLGADSSASNDRFHLGLHQFSIKKLIDAGTVSPLDYPSFAKNELGIGHIEFAADFYSPMLSPQDAKTIREQSERFGVTNRTVLCTGSHSLDAVNAKDRLAAVDHFQQWAKAARQLGCEFIRIRATTEGDAETQLTNAAEGIGRLCDRVSGTGVKVLVENIAGHSRDPKWLLSLINKVGRDRLGLIADFGNFDRDLYDGMEQLLPYTESVCTKSWEFDADGNETKIDYAKMMKVITDSKFSGCIAIEYLGDEPRTGIAKTAQLVRRYW